MDLCNILEKFDFFFTEKFSTPIITVFVISIVNPYYLLYTDMASPNNCS